MNTQPELTAPPPTSPRLRIRALAVVTTALLLCFARPLYVLARFALASELYAYILLVPFITGYLIWWNKRNLALDSKPRRSLAVFPLLAGLGVLAGYWLSAVSGDRKSVV